MKEIMLFIDDDKENLYIRRNSKMGYVPVFTIHIKKIKKKYYFESDEFIKILLSGVISKEHLVKILELISNK